MPLGITAAAVERVRQVFDQRLPLDAAPLAQPDGLIERQKLRDELSGATRVLVESRDKSTGERWFTVGVSPNIVDASFEALIDSITYKLLRAGAAA